MNVEPTAPDLKGKSALLAADMYEKAKLLAIEWNYGTFFLQTSNYSLIILPPPSK